MLLDKNIVCQNSTIIQVFLDEADNLELISQKHYSVCAYNQVITYVIEVWVVSIVQAVTTDVPVGVWERLSVNPTIRCFQNS